MTVFLQEAALCREVRAPQSAALENIPFFKLRLLRIYAYATIKKKGRMKMKKNYRKFFAVILAGLMVLSMAACSGNNGGGNNGQQGGDSSSEKQKIVIWNNNTNENQLKVLEAQMNEIAAELDFEFEMVAVSFNEMYTKLATAIDAGEAPDIMNTNFAGCAYLYENDMLTELTDVIETIGKDEFVESYLRVLTVGDSIWGLPDWSMHTSVWYRKDLFEEYDLEIPTTWDEFMECAKTLCIDEDNDGNIDIYGFPVPMDPVQVAPQTFYEMFYSAGGTTVDPETGEYTFGDQLDLAEHTMEYMIELYKEASPPAATSWTWSDYRNALVEGTVAMTLDMGAVIGNAQDSNPDMVEKLGCFDFPGIDGNKAASFGSGYAFVAGNTGSDEKIELVKEILTKLYTPERAAERALARPMFAFPAMYEALEIYKADESVAAFQTEIDTIVDAFENSNWYWYGMEHEFSGLCSQIESTTFFGEAMQSVALGTMTAREAVEYIDTNLQEQIALLEE